MESADLLIGELGGWCSYEDVHRGLGLSFLSGGFDGGIGVVLVFALDR